MVLVGGPRQVGKTYLAKTFLPKSGVGYLNWDIDEHRARILEKSLPNTKLWVFDELHKYRGWRNFLKGLYDQFGDQRRMLITGSARLDFYRFGGDSLQGRYHYLRLHPFSVAELDIRTMSDFEQLLNLSGFPEPFLSASQSFSRRWSREYRTRVIREELVSLEQTQDLGRLELLAIRLPELVGSPLSINAVREDLQVAHKTVAKWLDIFERLYHLFRVSPFGSPTIRAVKKEQKHYHFDWALVPEKPARFENLVAAHLLKWCHFREDTEGYQMELRYFRDTDGREVDFVVLEERQPILFVECKWSERQVSNPLAYLKAKFPKVRAVQLVATLKEHKIATNGIEIVPAITFLRELV